MSSPLFQESGRRGVRFTSGYLTGGVASAIAIVILLVPMLELLAHVSIEVRQAALIVGVAGFAALDVAGRTPYLRRQVPQRFYLQSMGPGWLGLVYGVDVGLHVTTQKSTSLVWVALLGAVLVGDTSVVAAVTLTLALVTSVLLVGLASTNQGRWLSDLELHSRGVPWTKYGRYLSAVLALLLAANEASRAGWL